MQYAVGMQYTVEPKKVSSHSGLSKYGWWGSLPLVQKGQTHAVCSRYTICNRYAVGVSAKRSTHTVDLANMGGPLCELTFFALTPTAYCVPTAYCIPHCMGLTFLH